MDQKQAMEQAIDDLLQMEAAREFHEALRDAREQLTAGTSPEEVPALWEGPVARLVRMRRSGQLDVAALIAMAALPDDDAPRAATGIPAATGEEAPQVTSTARSVTTFLFLADPQVSQAQKSESPNRIDRLSTLNRALAGLSELTWPTGQPLRPLSCAGLPIGPIDAIVFGGDMCQTGGSYDLWDQFFRNPTSYRGGYELQAIRRLFQPGFVGGIDFEVTTTNHTPCYFGLGNHDTQDDYTPPFIWNSLNPGSTPTDYWRDQMWNFICQMHAGVVWHKVWARPAYPVTSIDADGKGGFNWHEHSFNYKVDLGPVDVYQVHRWGGDDAYGRPDGLDWLKRELDRRGPHRPVIIAQHDPFILTDPISPSWTEAQRDKFLEFLAPYNVIALLTGHIHSGSDFGQPTTIPSTQGTFREFRPGSSCDDGRFALIRVGPTALDVIFGCGLTGSVVFDQDNAGGFPIDAFDKKWDRVPGGVVLATPPAVSIPDDDSVRYAYARGADGLLYHSTWHAQPLGWDLAWSPLGGVLAGRPVVVSASPGTHDVFCVGIDSQVYHLRSDGTTRSALAPLGGTVHPDVTALVTGPGRIDVFALGLDGRLWHLSGGTGGFGSWEQLDGFIVSRPSAAAVPLNPTVVRVVAVGPDSDLVHQIYDPSNGFWTHQWVSSGGELTSDPVIIASSPVRLDVFACGKNMDIQHRFGVDTDWGSHFGSLGGELSSPPAAIANSAGRIDVFAIQSGHTVGRTFYDGNWGSVTSQGGLSDAPPTLTTHHGSNAVDVFALGLTGAAYHRRYN